MAKPCFLNEEVRNKWKPIIEHEDLVPIKDRTIRNNTIRVLENEEKDLKEATVAGDMQNWDPVLISMVRRSMPDLIANNIVGVQPMSGPTGLIFAIKAYYGATPGGTEALGITEPNKDYSGKFATAAGEALGVGRHVDTSDAGAAQDPVLETNPWPEMSFDIQKTSVTAETRALKAKYTEELAQDLRAIHGLDAETELANILSAEIVAEQNRELVYEINTQAIAATAFDLNVDADGRWEYEKFKTLIHKINKEANQVAKDTRRGRANFIIASANVVSALQTAGRFEIAGGGLGTLEDAGGVGITEAGIMNGSFRVIVDPYASVDYVTVGYKGPNVYDAGIFWAPYVPLNMMRAKGEEDFQPRIGFKTRYGLAYNPFVTGTAGQNVYYRRFTVANV